MMISNVVKAFVKPASLAFVPPSKVTSLEMKSSCDDFRRAESENHETQFGFNDTPVKYAFMSPGEAGFNLARQTLNEV